MNASKRGSKEETEMKVKKLLLAVSAATLTVGMIGSADAGHYHDGGVNLPAPLNDSDFIQNSEAKIKLGKNLFYDKILGGNKNIACATCHHGLTASGDGLSLPIGEGGQGLGMIRNTGSGADAVHERVPRNAPHVWNAQALEMDTMFHDGRVTVDDSQPSGFATPAGDDFPHNLDSILSAQAMFPITSGAEMAGQPGENEVADAGAANGVVGVWSALEARLKAIPEYVNMFIATFDDIDSADDITMGHAANAIAAFEGDAFKANNTPFDRYLRGDKRAMSASAVGGMQLFYGKANCSTCHSGSLMSDQDFHATAMPQTGPGRGSDFDGRDDFGREQVTGDAVDIYKFRTPTLRNVAPNGPWGHSGAYNTLEAAVQHMVDPVNSLNNYDTEQLALPPRDDLDAIDNLVMADPARVANIAAANEITPVSLSNAEFNALMDFMNALTDPESVNCRVTVPMTVPSGLPVAD
jgi:cytochrome c peroxidase